MTFGIIIVVAWVVGGVLSIGEAILSNTYRIAILNYLICLIMLIFQLFFDYILKA